MRVSVILEATVIMRENKSECDIATDDVIENEIESLSYRDACRQSV
jgi:hypothetical protein